MKSRYLLSGLFGAMGLIWGLAAGKYIWDQQPPQSPRAQASVSGPQTPEPGVPTEWVGKLHLFLLTGQSNMSGHGKLRDSDRKTHPRIYMLGNDYHWKAGREPVDDATHQVDAVSNDGLGPEHDSLGPSMAFAKALTKAEPKIAVGLIPCALGGTSILAWQKNLSDETLYGSCLKRARAASPMGKIAGILFFQGEADAMDPKKLPDQHPAPTRWAELFTQWVFDFRTDLNDPQLPVVFAQIGKTIYPEFTQWDEVKKQQASIHLPRVAMIHTEDLALEDGLHFKSESYDKIGERFAQAYLEVIGKKQGLR